MPDKKYNGRYKQLVVYYNKEDYTVVNELKENGFSGALIGESLLKQADPEKALKRLIYG